MTAMIVTYLILGLLALAVGAALGAALHRSVIAEHMLDLDGEIEGLRMRIADAKGHQERG
jgi:hypothetical protein